MLTRGLSLYEIDGQNVSAGPKLGPYLRNTSKADLCAKANSHCSFDNNPWTLADGFQTIVRF
jgi:hypothetical protein